MVGQRSLQSAQPFVQFLVVRVSFELSQVWALLPEEMSFLIASVTVMQPSISNFFVIVPHAQVFSFVFSLDSPFPIVSSTSLQGGNSVWDVPSIQKVSAYFSVIQVGFADGQAVKSYGVQFGGVTLKQLFKLQERVQEPGQLGQEPPDSSSPSFPRASTPVASCDVSLVNANVGSC